MRNGYEYHLQFIRCAYQMETIRKKHSNRIVGHLIGKSTGQIVIVRPSDDKIIRFMCRRMNQIAETAITFDLWKILQQNFRQKSSKQMRILSEVYLRCGSGKFH